MCVEARGQPLSGVVPQVLETWGSAIQLNWLVSKSPEALPPPPQECWALQALALDLVLGIELRPSFLCGKHSTDGAISPVPLAVWTLVLGWELYPPHFTAPCLLSVAQGCGP